MALVSAVEVPTNEFAVNSLKAGLILATAVWIVYGLVQCIQNVYFHPLSEFPGPPLAAATSWWSAYQQALTHKSMHHICIDLHAKYGDIIRIGPNRVRSQDGLIPDVSPMGFQTADIPPVGVQLHFNHPTHYDDIYRKRFDKDPYMYALLGGDGATVTFVKHSDNKDRKDILHPFFSKSAVFMREKLIEANINKFCTNLTRLYDKGASVNMSLGFRCIGLETITTLCFGDSASCFESEDFHSPILDSMESIVSWFMVFKHFWVVRQLILLVPEWVALFLFKRGVAFAQMKDTFAQQIDKIQAGLDKEEDTDFPLIYRALCDPEKYTKGKRMPTRASLLEESIALAIAGTDTTGATMTMATYQLCKYPDKMARVKAEIKQLWPDLRGPMPKAAQLEKLPYLTAVIKEALRMAPTTTSENSRLVPAKGAKIGDDFIPGNTIVSMGVLFPMQHPYAFENPEQFIPERWLTEDPEARERHERFFVPFSKGPRSCLGINLAWCEMYLALASLYRRFDIRLDGTTDEDFDWIDVGLALFKAPLKCHVSPVVE